MEGLQEPLLLLELRGAPLLILDDVVVVGAEQGAIRGDPLDERGEIEVSPRAGFFKGVVQVAAVNKNCDALIAITPGAELIGGRRQGILGGRKAPPSYVHRQTGSLNRFKKI